MDDFLRYEEFFKDDEESDGREHDDSSGKSAGSRKYITERNAPQKSPSGEKGADTGCMILLMLWVLRIIYVLFKLLL